MILLDTQVLLWVASDSEQLGRRAGPEARRLIDHAAQQGEVAVSAITFWEISMLADKRRITLLRDLASWRRALLQDGLVEIPMDGEIGIRAGQLDDFHGDPADRLIVATALEGHRLMTADQRILNWPGPLARIRATD